MLACLGHWRDRPHLGWRSLAGAGAAGGANFWSLRMCDAKSQIDTMVSGLDRALRLPHETVYTACVHKGGVKPMQTINVRETRERLSSLLDAVAAGEEILIMRNGKPAARLIAPGTTPVAFEDRATLRAELPPMMGSAADVVRQLRDDERF